MTEVVLDASALLALLFDEPGAHAVADAVTTGASVSTVNLAEVATVLVHNNRDIDRVLEQVREQVTVEPFVDADANAVAVLYPKVSSAGLSLGDRACLALAERLGVPAVTAERIWDRLDVNAAVQCIRPSLDT